MNRTLLSSFLCMVLTGLTLSAPNLAEAATSQTSTTAVTLNVTEAIEVVSWPEASLSLTSIAVPGQPIVSAALRFTVKCNSNWGIQVKSDEPEGRLREFSVGTATYVADGKASQKAMEWGVATTGPWTAVSGTTSNIVTNQTSTGETGSQVSMYLRYVPGFNDVPLTGDRVYRSVLSYTAAVGY